MAKRFVLGRDEDGSVEVQSRHTIGSVSDQFEQNGRGITGTTPLDVLDNPQMDIALMRLPTFAK